MMAPTLSAGAARGAGGSLVAERNASLASCLVRSTNAICCDPSTVRTPPSAQPVIHFLHQNSFMRTDALTMALSALGIATVAIVARYLPARRATAIAPMRALRGE